MDRPLRVALLSYRSKPHCGGQGIYLRHLSRELAALGHQVEVISGQPYPELDPGPVLRALPSLDLYRDEDPFRTPHLREYRDWIDALEVAGMWTGMFPEPLTFSLRALRELKQRHRGFDVVHDNQVLGYGMLGIRRLGVPMVTSIHHPISVDRRVFHPRHGPRVPGRVIAVASADSPMKGVAVLLHAVAKLATERDVRVTVVAKPTPGGLTEQLARDLALGDRVRFVHGISDGQLAELLASAEIAVVPSLYEGFSLPAVEHLASGTPLVVSRTGALPEVVGDAAVQVPPGDTEALAAVLRELHDSPQRRARLSELAWRRVQERFAWPAVARATVARYGAAIGERRARLAPRAAALTKGGGATKGAGHC